MTGSPALPALLAHWQLTPPVATLAAAGLAYRLGARRVRRWPRRRSAAFAAGLGLLAVALASGVDAWADARFSVHMLQHLLLALVAPPLLAAGAPVSLALRALAGTGRRRAASVLHARPVRVLAHPASGFTAFTAAMLGAHLPAVHELALRHALMHDAEHVALVAAGLLFWAPLVGADPLPGRPRAAGRLAWLLAVMPPMGLLAAWLLTGGLRYPAYAATTPDPLADQRAAASVMWVGGSLVVATALVVLTFAALWEEESRQRRREAVA